MVLGGQSCSSRVLYPTRRSCLWPFAFQRMLIFLEIGRTRRALWADKDGTQGLICKSGRKCCAVEKTHWLQPNVWVLVNPFVSIPVSISFIPNSDGLGKLQIENSIIDLKKSSKSFQRTAYFLGGNFLLSFPLPTVLDLGRNQR